MYRARLFAVRHARAYEWLYRRFEAVMVALDPLFKRIGYNRVEKPVATVEKLVKGALFDCKMCGQCVLSSTGMSCPMNCPKQLRNGPCGGVRPGGYCEVDPAMKCVWVLAWDGAARMAGGERIHAVLPPVDRRLEGTSSWLRESREKAAVAKNAQTPDNRDSKDTPRSTMARAFDRARQTEPSSAPLAVEPDSARKSGGRT